MLLEHDDLSDVDQPREKHTTDGSEDELQHSERCRWWIVLVVTRDDHSVGVDDDTVGSSVTAPTSSVSAHGFLLDQG